MSVKLIAFDAGWVLFRPGNWEVLHKNGFTDDEGYWLLREVFGRANDWILYQFKRGKTSKQIIAILKKFYPKHTELLNRVLPLLKKLVCIDYEDNIKLGYQLQKVGYIVEIWSDNGLGGTKKKKYKDSDIGLIPELPDNSPLYKKYTSVHQELKVPSVYSRDLNVKKENPEFFKKAIARHKDIHANEVVFIEDRPQNIESAMQLGINCIQFVAATNEREPVKGVAVAHTTRELLNELKKKGVFLAIKRKKR